MVKETDQEQEQEQVEEQSTDIALPMSRKEQIAQWGTYQETGGAELHKEDARPPVLILAQSNNVDKYPETGHFYRIDTGEAFESIDLIALHIQPTRSKFAPGAYQADRRPDCMSMDAKRPVKVMPFSDALTIPYAMSAKDLQKNFMVAEAEDAVCKGCPFQAENPFSTDPNAGMCMPQYVGVFADANTMEPMIITFRGASSRGGRIFGSKSNYRKRMITLSSEHVSGQSGAYERMTFLPYHEILPDDIQAMINGAIEDFQVSEAFAASFAEGEVVAEDEVENASEDAFSTDGA